ncbi:MAG: hypothetical protein ACYC91_14770 [Solirubrobacteraceae bacterium]
MLRRDAQRIRVATAARNAPQARAAVAMLRTDIAHLNVRGELARPDARVLMVEANQIDGRVLAELKPVSAPAMTRPSTVTPTTPAPPAMPPSKASPGAGGGDGNGDGKDHGHGPGHGGG